MGTIQYGDKLQGFIKMETGGSYGVPNNPTTGDGFKARMINLEASDRRREAPDDDGGTFSVLERAEGRHMAKWTATVLLRLSGSLGVAPDIGDFLKLAFGTETVTGSTSVVYTQLEDRSALHAGIWADLGDVVEFVRGAVCSQLKITWGGDDWIVLEFSGPAKEFGETSENTTDGWGTAQTTITMDDMDYYATYSLVQLGTNTNGGSGFFMTSLDFSAETAELDTSESWQDEITVAPYLPTPVFTGSLVPFGTKVTTSIDGGSTTQRALGGEIVLDTGLGLLNEEEGSDCPTEVINTGKWKVSGNMKIVCRKSDVNLFSQSRRQVQKDVRWTFGTASGYKMQIDADQVEFDPVAKDIPDSGMVTVTMPFEALGSTGEDNLSATLI